MRIYTRTGDDGTTSLFGGQRLRKDDLRIEAYGTLDELNVCIGELGAFAAISESKDAAFLRVIQSDVFSWGSHLATIDSEMAKHLPPIPETRVAEMEAWMDAKNEALPPLSQFILPGGHPAIVAAHKCRVVCRRGERRVIALGRDEDTPDGLIAYLNRLSDLFFMWSRYLHVVTNTPEIPWESAP
ncbi:MAG: ATP:cob(I)alamin adenosyltransferase [Crocinitomicaceae bacterium]|nr:ATP:cob(I)alamin adenosyltransferase [Crocinitomicaceae bacterium]